MAMDADEITSLSQDASVVSEKEVQSLIYFIQERLDRIIGEFEKK